MGIINSCRWCTFIFTGGKKGIYLSPTLVKCSSSALLRTNEFKHKADSIKHQNHPSKAKKNALRTFKSLKIKLVSDLKHLLFVNKKMYFSGSAVFPLFIYLKNRQRPKFHFLLFPYLQKWLTLSST